MRILWFTNVELNCIAEQLGRTIVVGGWMNTMAIQLSENVETELFVACYTDKDEYWDKKAHDISFFSLNKNSGVEYCTKIISYVRPDVIHIWGTETSRSYYAIQAAEKVQMLDHTVVSIQGLVSVYSRHYLDGVPAKLVYHKTVKEFIKNNNLYHASKVMEKQGKEEIFTLKKAKHCIGRTDWDYACAKQINPKIQYHFCNETLRPRFYESEWNYEECKKNTLFFSQSHYPIKGLHNILVSLSIVKQFYPDVKVRILGNNPIPRNFLERLKQGTYERYITDLILNNQLEENIEWLGRLDEESMVREYLRANVFVCSSSIENSSNSIGEAMLIGTPVVAADVGGIKSLMKHNEEGILYQGTAPYMLADGIIRLFQDNKMASYMGANARKRALKTYNIGANFTQLVTIYNCIR